MKTKPMNKGLTIDEVFEAVKLLPECPKLTDLTFIENSLLPDNTVLVSKKIMKLLKDSLNQTTNP